MNSKVIFAFILGTAAGLAVSWKFNEKKYAAIADREIESVKEKFSVVKVKSEEVPQDTEQEDVIEVTEEEKAEYNNILSERKYTNYSNPEQKEEKGGDTMAHDYYIIAPNEFGEIDEYETNELTYYADGILADDGDDIIDDIENLIGEDSLLHFGEYEDDPDTIYVRNDRLRTDYEITRDQRRYADVVDGYPYGSV